jgi:cytidylate kinase
MQTQIVLEKCLPVLNSEIQPWTRAVVQPARSTALLSVTISRQSGSGAHVVATKLAQYLQEQAPDPDCPWAVFDRNLVEKVLEDHHLPRRFAQFMPEDRTPEIAEVLDELLGHHPPSAVLVQQTAETVLSLAQRGHVILIGRGANIITRELDNVLHVRLVAPLDQRVTHVQQVNQLSEKAALQLIQHEDRGRQRYLRKYFGRDLEDPRLYHLTINTGLVGFDQAARMICDAALNGLHRRTERPAL